MRGALSRVLCGTLHHKVLEACNNRTFLSDRVYKIGCRAGEEFFRPLSPRKSLQNPPVPIPKVAEHQLEVQPDWMMVVLRTILRLFPYIVQIQGHRDCGLDY